MKLYMFRTVPLTVHRDKFLIIKPTRCTNYSNLFWNETLHVSDSSSVRHQEFFTVHTAMVQGDSVARGPKLLSIKSYVIEIITWNFIYTYRERCKTGPAHNRCWNWSPFISKHTWMRFSKFWNTFPKVSALTAWISWCIASLSCSIVRGVFLYTLPFNRPQRKKSAGVR